MKQLTLLASVVLSLGMFISGCVTDNSTVALQQTNIKNDVTVNAENVPAFNIDKIVSKMGKRKRIMDCGFSRDAGVWVVTRVDIKQDPKNTQEQQFAMAEIMAKKSIASWMESSISSEAALQQSQVLDDDRSVHIKQVYTSLTNTKTEAFLRGVTMHSYTMDASGLHVYFFSTGKIVDATAELEAQLRAAPEGTVRATGFGMITAKGRNVAKKQAVNAALRNAVEQVMGTTVIGQSTLMDNAKAKSKLISQTCGNVKQYRIVNEGEQGEAYRVVLNAKVDENDLLNNYASIVRSMGNPGFIISSSDPDLKIAITDFFNSLGFYVTKDVKNAQFQVKADCKYLPVHDDYYGDGLQIAVNMSLVDCKTSQQLISIQNEPRFTSTYSGDIHVIRQGAAGKAFRSLKDELHKKLNKIVMDWVLNGRDVKLICSNLTDSQTEKIIEEAISWDSCAKYQTKNRTTDAVVFSCAYVGPSADFVETLMERLRQAMPEDKLPTVSRYDLNTIELKF